MTEMQIKTNEQRCCAYQFVGRHELHERKAGFCTSTQNDQRFMTRNANSRFDSCDSTIYAMRASRRRPFCPSRAHPVPAHAIVIERDEQAIRLIDPTSNQSNLEQHRHDRRLCAVVHLLDEQAALLRPIMHNKMFKVRFDSIRSRYGVHESAEIGAVVNDAVRTAKFIFRQKQKKSKIKNENTRQ